jgi:TnsA endonuclease N terminal.
VLRAHEFAEWCQRLRLSPSVIEAVEEIRGSEPSRRVGARSRSVWGRFPSDKMGRTIGFESHTVELAGIWEYEHDPLVLEFYDQPPPIKLSYESASQRPLGVVHTPDFFVLRVDGAGWEEWKDEGTLVRLADRAPGRYRRDPDGWSCPPGEAVARPLGLSYRLRSDVEIDPVVYANLRFLDDYLWTVAPVPQAVADVLRDVVVQEPGITVELLLDRASELLITMPAGRVDAAG